MDEPTDATRAETPGAKARAGSGPRRIDRYQLTELLGEGGMGAVYRAEQLEPVRRSVAVKVIRGGRFVSERIAARFELERQVLALMAHPNIAQLYDAGVTPDGEPYFVMELVAGAPITDYADAETLPVRARLALFLDVCRAIEHAHQKGILHRDIKPSNVLVATADGRAVPKVIDFGVAKAISGEVAMGLQPTQLGLPIGTLAFASPEQLDPAQAATADTRSDVYGLGMLLYLLLVGAAPFSARHPTELLDRILNAEPTPLVRRLEGSGSVAEIASARGTRVEDLRRELGGDLEWIVRRALEKRPADRYPSVAELRADIERFLEDRPVLASPPSLGSRARKFVRRNRLAVAAGAIVALSLVGAVVGTSVALVRSRRAEARAASEAEKAKAVNEFLNEMLGSASPRAEGKDVRVSEVLDRASSDLARRFRDRPDVAAALRRTLAETYDGLGLPERAEREARLAYEMMRSAFGADDPRTLVAEVELGAMLHDLGRLRDGVALVEKATRALAARVPQGDPRLLDARITLATDLTDVDREEEGIALARETLATMRETLGVADPRTLDGEARVALILRNSGEYAESEALHRALLPRLRAVVGAEAPDTLAVENNLGQVLNDQKKFAEAAEIYRDLIERQRRTHGDDHPEMLTSEHNLVRSLVGLGRLAEAEELCRRVLSTRRRVLGDDHPHTIYSIGALGAILSREGHAEAAMPLLEETIERGTRVLGADHITVARAREILAEIRNGGARAEKAPGSAR